MSAPESACITVGWIIASNIVIFVLGFMANRFLGNRTANRNEDHGLIDDISKLVANIETKAYTYYSLSADDVEATRIAAEIRSLMSQIARQVQFFSNHYPNTRMSGHVVRLRQAVTFHLDDSTRTVLLESSPVFDEISKQCRILSGELLMLFNKKYREVKHGFNF